MLPPTRLMLTFVLCIALLFLPSAAFAQCGSNCGQSVFSTNCSQARPIARALTNVRSGVSQRLQSFRTRLNQRCSRRRGC